MNQFEKVPTALATDTTLTLQARAVYPVLLAEAWRLGARAGERVELPPLRELAHRCGCSESSLKNQYLRELRDAGWIETVRKARGRPQAYVIHAVRGSESNPQDEPRGSESNPRVGQNLPHSRARDPSSADRKGPDDPPSPPTGGEPFEEPPRPVRVGGRNLPVDALCEACGIDPASPRVKQAVVAVAGRSGQQGIRDLFWVECCRYAAEQGREDALAALHDDPATFEVALARRIERKTAAIRVRDRWRTSLSPAAVRDLWLDVELTAPGAGLTPDQIAARA